MDNFAATKRAFWLQCVPSLSFRKKLTRDRKFKTSGDIYFSQTFYIEWNYLVPEANIEYKTDLIAAHTELSCAQWRPMRAQLQELLMIIPLRSWKCEGYLLGKRSITRLRYQVDFGQCWPYICYFLYSLWVCLMFHCYIQLFSWGRISTMVVKFNFVDSNFHHIWNQCFS